jgi:hypothetical protein
MVSQPYVEGITDTVPHGIASGLTAGQILVGEDTITVSVICPDRWFPGDFAVVTSRDGLAFAGEVEDIDVYTGQVVIRGGGQLGARDARLRGLRVPCSADRRVRSLDAIIERISTAERMMLKKFS